ncbi:MAG: cytochrome c1 [Pseudomonadota bacterium]|jgi:ubiquinol-cytochrome c reductase cytochrome c1 subunit
MKKFFLSLLVSFGFVTGAAAAGGGYAWDKFPNEKMSDMAALQHGAQLFVNYCLNCHSANYMRYNRMQDIGLSDAEIKKNLLFAADKVGDTMKVSLDPKQATEWLAAAPPDLTLIARSRADVSKGSGADYLYTYMRTFYRDDTKATGWNNMAFPDVAMPHVLWELQGQRVAKFVEEKDAHDPSKTVHRFTGFEQVTPGKLNDRAYDEAVGDLVAYLQWMGEPAQEHRVRIGVWVLLFLSVLTIFTWRLNASYWKDVK